MAIKTVKATINGQSYDLTYNESTGKYEATITAPSESSYNNNSEHYYPITLTATDDGDNSTSINDSDEKFGANLKLRVKEKVAPTITITAPTTGASLNNSQPTITAQLRDNDSGIDISSLILKVDSIAVDGASIVKNAVSSGYDISYTIATALSDGNHIISVQVTDNDGNQCEEVTSTFVVDTVPPTLIVTSPEDGFVTNNNKITVSGTTNDETSSPVTVTVTVNGSAQTVTVDDDGSFSDEITLKEGDNEIVIVARDSSGQETSITRHVTLDTKAPVFVSVNVTPNPVDAGKTYVISVEVTD